MEYALLIDSYRVPQVKHKTIFSTDNLVYFLGAALFVIPLTRLSLYFGLFTVILYCFIFILLNLFETNLIKLLFARKEEMPKAEIKIAIDFKRLGLNFGFKNRTFSFNFFFYVFSPTKKGRILGLSPPRSP